MFWNSARNFPVVPVHKRGPDLAAPKYRKAYCHFLYNF